MRLKFWDQFAQIYILDIKPKDIVFIFVFITFKVQISKANIQINSIRF